MAIVVPRTWVAGTPRGYGDNKVAAVWLTEMAAALERYRGASKGNDASTTRYEVTLEFRIHPGSPKYRGRSKPHGTDLDNLVKQTLDGMSETVAESLPRGLAMLTSDAAIYRLVATKDHVDSDDETGVWITVQTI